MGSYFTKNLVIAFQDSNTNKGNELQVKETINPIHNNKIGCIRHNQKKLPIELKMYILDYLHNKCKKCYCKIHVYQKHITIRNKFHFCKRMHANIWLDRTQQPQVCQYRSPVISYWY